MNCFRHWYPESVFKLNIYLGDVTRNRVMDKDRNSTGSLYFRLLFINLKLFIWMESRSSNFVPVKTIMLSWLIVSSKSGALSLLFRPHTSIRSRLYCCNVPPIAKWLASIWRSMVRKVPGEPAGSLIASICWDLTTAEFKLSVQSKSKFDLGYNLVCLLLAAVSNVFRGYNKYCCTKKYNSQLCLLR